MPSHEGARLLPKAIFWNIVQAKGQSGTTTATTLLCASRMRASEA